MFIPWLNDLDGTTWPTELQPYLIGHDPEHLPHALALYQAIIDLNAQVVVELGTRFCKSLRIIVEALKVTKGHVYTIDSVGYRLELSSPQDSDYVTAIVSNDLDVTWDQPIDVLFSDCCHEYRHTIQELEKFWPSVKMPGLVIVADTDSHWEAKRAVTDWAEQHHRGMILDFRGQGAAYFPKPTYSTQYRDRTKGLDEWHRHEDLMV